MRRLRIGPRWCPACGCDVSAFVRAEVAAWITARAKAAGQKGGTTRGQRLSPERRREIARLGGLARKRTKTP